MFYGIAPNEKEPMQQPMGMEIKPTIGDQTGTLGFRSVTVENINNFLINMSADQTADLARRMFEKCNDPAQTSQNIQKLKTSDLKKELKKLDLVANDDNEKKGTGLRQIAVFKNLLNEVKTEARNEQLTDRPKTKKFCEFLKDATSQFTRGKELFSEELNHFVSEMSSQSAYGHYQDKPPAYSAYPEVNTPTKANAPAEVEALPVNPEYRQEYIPEYQPPVSTKLADKPSSPVVAEQTTVTQPQMNQIMSMIQTFSIQDKKPENLPAKTSEKIHSGHKAASQLSLITNLSANTVAKPSGNWGNRVELGNGLSMTFQTHANHCDETMPNHLGIRQTAFNGVSINKKDLDTNESRRVGMTFIQEQLIGTQNEKDQHIALELGAPGAITYIPKVQLSSCQPGLKGYQPAGENYVFFTIKFPTGKIISEGCHLPAFDLGSVSIRSSDEGKDIKGFDFTTRLEELEAAYKQAEGTSFYDRPENVLSIKITPYWGYERTQAVVCASAGYADTPLIDSATGEELETDCISGEFGIACGFSRGATLASEKTFGSSDTKDASASFVMPGKSVYIDIAAYQVR